MRIADRIEAGTVYINNYFNAATQSPVGGYKQSGYGRENGFEGMRCFMQTKSVWPRPIRTSPIRSPINPYAEHGHERQRRNLPAENHRNPGAVRVAAAPAGGAEIPGLGPAVSVGFVYLAIAFPGLGT